MPVEIALNTPLANALNNAIQPKLREVGWGTGGDDSTMAEYIVLMLANGKTQDQIAADLSGDLLGLPADDPDVHNFARWLFEQIDQLNSQLNGGQSVAENDNNGLSQHQAPGGETDIDMGSADATEINAPTGPKSMRNGNTRGKREKRMFGQVLRRTFDDAVRGVRGNGSERINTHGRTPPSGPRNAQGRQQQNLRAANVQNGLAAGPQAGGWMANGSQPSQMELMAMIEQQNQMMFQLSQQLMNGGQGTFGNQRRGKSLFDRVQDPNRKRGNHHGQQAAANAQRNEGPGGGGEGSEDVEMSGETREPPNPDETVCRYNLHCTNKECKFGHQSPAAPPGTSVDVGDACSFGVACKNRKCVGRHPSPATKLAHQSEQECKFYPNCQNPRCPFKHPSMPLCRNGAGCSTDDCKFTHVTTKCRFQPCMNPKCAFAHEQGQQGGFKDKVWTAESAKEHVSERKFVVESGQEEFVRADGDEVTTGLATQDVATVG